MNTHALTIFFRRYKKQGKIYIISLLSLCLSIAVGFLLLAYVQNGSTFDEYNKNINELYILKQRHVTSETAGYDTNQTPPAFADYIKDHYPEIDEVCLMLETWGDYIQSTSDNQYYEEDGFYADPSAFQLFTYEFIQGNPAQALVEPGSIVLSESVAKRLFPNGNALGQVVTSSKKYPLTVTGVYKDLPYNMHIRPTYLCSFSLYTQIMDADYRTSLYNQAFKTYAIIHKNNDVRSLNNKVNTLYADQNIESKYKPYFSLVSKERDPGNRYLIYIASAMLLLLLSAFNYVNTAIIGFSHQVKDFGIRQVMGADRRDLLTRLIKDVVFLALFVVGVSYILTVGLLPYFNQLTGSHIQLSFQLYWKPVLGMLLFSISTLLAGVIVPMVKIVSNKISPVLKGDTQMLKQKSVFQSSLLVLQFIICICFLVYSFVMEKQMKYVNDVELGFNPKGIIFSSPVYNGNNASWRALLKEQLEKKPGIENVSFSNCIPFYGNSVELIQNQQGEHRISGSRNWVGYNYLKTFDMKLLEGRFFTDNAAAESGKCIVSQKTVEQLGLSNPVNTWIKVGRNQTSMQIIGVVANYEIYSCYSESVPMIFYPSNYHSDSYDNKLAVSFDSSIISPEEIKQYTAEIIPDLSFDYIDYEDFVYRERGLYDLQNSTSLFLFFTFISLLISLMGLYNVVAVNTQRRTKEIGIRKVNGARTIEIVWMFNRNLLYKIALSFLVACPIAFYTIKQWLEDFAYKVELSGWLFMQAGCITVGIVLITASLQCFYTASQNPVKALRYE